MTTYRIRKNEIKFRRIRNKTRNISCIVDYEPIIT